AGARIGAPGPDRRVAQEAGPGVSGVEAAGGGDAAARRERLVELYKEVADCRRCPLYETRTKAVFGAGNADARRMFVGEAAGGGAAHALGQADPARGLRDDPGPARAPAPRASECRGDGGGAARGGRRPAAAARRPARLLRMSAAGRAVERFETESAAATEALG